MALIQMGGCLTWSHGATGLGELKFQSVRNAMPMAERADVTSLLADGCFDGRNGIIGRNQPSGARVGQHREIIQMVSCSKNFIGRTLNPSRNLRQRGAFIEGFV